MVYLNIAKFIMSSDIEGPGKRFVVWFQGCKIVCEKCCNKEMISLEKKIVVDVKTFFGQIQIAIKKYNIQGITIIGGEPFLQANGLKKLLKLCKKNNLNVICFSGYLFENLKKEYKWILKNIDILIDGPFIFSKLDLSRRIIGSTNQRVIKITNVFEESNYFDEPYSNVEIQILKNRLQMNGDGTPFNDENGFKFKIN